MRFFILTQVTPEEPFRLTDFPAWLIEAVEMREWTSSREWPGSECSMLVVSHAASEYLTDSYSLTFSCELGTKMATTDFIDSAISTKIDENSLNELTNSLENNVSSVSSSSEITVNTEGKQCVSWTTDFKHFILKSWPKKPGSLWKV